jgi:hypothetical protein
VATLAAQRPVGARGVRALDFGMLLPGVQSAVGATDAFRAGQFEIIAAKGDQVEITLVLPAALASAAGDLVPLDFGPESVAFSESGNKAVPVAVPGAPFTVRLERNGRGFVYVGGRALPSPTQRSGPYAATVALTIAYTGL